MWRQLKAQEASRGSKGFHKPIFYPPYLIVDGRRNASAATKENGGQSLQAAVLLSLRARNFATRRQYVPDHQRIRNRVRGTGRLMMAL
jgi:hypothetical protein